MLMRLLKFLITREQFFLNLILNIFFFKVIATKVLRTTGLSKNCQTCELMYCIYSTNETVCCKFWDTKPFIGHNKVSDMYQKLKCQNTQKVVCNTN